MKVVINTCWGGFSVSKAVYEYLGIPWDGYGYLTAFAKSLTHGNPDSEDIEKMVRSHPKLVEAVESLGLTANGSLARLKVVDIPDDVEWYISEYDGCETIEEVHRSWS